MRTDPSKIIPTSADTAEMWIEWHKSLKKWFRKEEANQHWLRFWNQRGGAGSGADTYSLRSYMETQDVQLTTTTMGSITDSTMDAVDFVGDTFTWARGLIIGGVIVGIGLIAFYIIYSTTKGKTPAQMAAEMPGTRRGRAARRIAAQQGVNPMDMNSFNYTAPNQNYLS